MQMSDVVVKQSTHEYAKFVKADSSEMVNK